MGLAAEARLAWIIVDTGVYLWSFEKQHAPNCYTYIPTKNGQYAIVAAIVRPKKGMYLVRRGEELPACRWMVVSPME